MTDSHMPHQNQEPSAPTGTEGTVHMQGGRITGVASSVVQGNVTYNTITPPHQPWPEPELAKAQALLESIPLDRVPLITPLPECSRMPHALIPILSVATTC
jgi:hypothetical protein